MSSDKLPSSVESISDERKFILVMADHKKPELVNDHSAPITELIHPLSYSLDIKHHPDMISVPMLYKFQRSDFKNLVDELKKE